MSKTVPSRPTAAHAIALALVTVLALLVAPVCGSLCAAKNCAAGMSQRQCRDMATMAPESGSQFVAPRNVCRGVDLIAVLVNSEETFFRLQNARIGSAPVAVHFAIEWNTGGPQAIPKRGRLHRSPSVQADTPRSSTILRI